MKCISRKIFHVFALVFFCTILLGQATNVFASSIGIAVKDEWKVNYSESSHGSNTDSDYIAVDTDEDIFPTSSMVQILDCIGCYRTYGPVVASDYSFSLAVLFILLIGILYIGAFLVAGYRKLRYVAISLLAYIVIVFVFVLSCLFSAIFIESYIYENEAWILAIIITTFFAYWITKKYIKYLILVNAKNLIEYKATRNQHVDIENPSSNERKNRFIFLGALTLTIVLVIYISYQFFYMPSRDFDRMLSDPSYCGDLSDCRLWGCCDDAIPINRYHYNAEFDKRCYFVDCITTKELKCVKHSCVFEEE